MKYLKLSLLALILIYACTKQDDDREKTVPDDLAYRIESMMVDVAGGTFEMGQTTSGLPDTSPIGKAESSVTDNNDPRPDELPVHSVTLSDFRISRYEVTQGLWKEVMGTIEPCWSVGEYGEDSQRAMDGVSWEDAVRFLDRLNELTGGSYRLPTEAEWEYAARGGKESRGYRYSGSDDFSEVGWCKEDNLTHVQKVGCKRPNELGLYDMSGNAFEWCYDWYGEYSSSMQYDPKGPDGENRHYQYAGNTVSFHVLRGGHWQSSSFGLRVSFRTKIPTANYKPKTGFRIASGIPYSAMNHYVPEANDIDEDTSADEFEKCNYGGVDYRKYETDGLNNRILIMYLHGGSSKGDDNETQLKEKAVGVIKDFIAKNELSAIFIVPQCPSSGTWGVKINPSLRNIISLYEKQCTGGIYVMGGSMGGTGTWTFANAYSELIKGIMPVAGKPGKSDPENFKDIRICTVMSEADAMMGDSCEEVSNFILSIEGLPDMTRCDIVPLSENWSHAHTCEESYTEERLSWLFELQM